MTDPPPPAGPPPGWYPDPTSGDGFRWWDGLRWTDHTATDLQPPPPTGLPAVQSDELAPASDWISEVLRLARIRAGNYLPMIVILIVPTGLVNGILVWFALRGVVLVTDADTGAVTFTGADDTGLLLAISIATFLVSLVAAAVLSVAVVRQNWTVVDDDAEPWSDSMRAAVSRLLPTVRVTAAVVGVLVAAYVVNVVAAAVVPPLLLLTVPVGLGVGVWLAIRLSLALVAVAKGPPATGALATSWRLTRSRAWGLFGRMALLGFIGLTFWLSASLVATPFTALAGGGATETLDPGADEIRFGDLLGDNPATFAIGQLFSSLANGATIVVWSIGMATIYRRVGGPVEDDGDGPDVVPDP